MILTDAEIEHAVEMNKVVIEPFTSDNINSNSYDVTLGDTLLVYKNKGEYDLKEEWDYDIIEIPEEGYVLEPGQLYLGVTNEVVGSHNHVPILSGRSSVGRAGIHIHVTAGFGDLGYMNNWTLEIHSLLPVRVYPNMRIGQIYFLKSNSPNVSYDNREKSKYTGEENLPVPTRLFKELGGVE